MTQQGGSEEAQVLDSDPLHAASLWKRPASAKDPGEASGEGGWWLALSLSGVMYAIWGGGGCVSMGSFKLNGFTFRGPRSQQLPCCPWALGHLGSALPA